MTHSPVHSTVSQQTIQCFGDLFSKMCFCAFFEPKAGMSNLRWRWATRQRKWPTRKRRIWRNWSRCAISSRVSSPWMACRHWTISVPTPATVSAPFTTCSATGMIRKPFSIYSTPTRRRIPASLLKNRTIHHRQRSTTVNLVELNRLDRIENCNLHFWMCRRFF